MIVLLYYTMETQDFDYIIDQLVSHKIINDKKTCQFHISFRNILESNMEKYNIFDAIYNTLRAYEPNLSIIEIPIYAFFIMNLVQTFYPEMSDKIFLEKAVINGKHPSTKGILIEDFIEKLKKDIADT